MSSTAPTSTPISTTTRSHSIALTVAGSDSGGGAGIQGDLKTFARWGVFGTSVITAITAQNTLGVSAWEAVSPALVRAQMDAVFGDLAPNAVKTGMLGTSEVAGTVIRALREHRPELLVVDPVLIATSGDSLADADAVKLMRESLFPLATLVTPNIGEAQLLLGHAISGEQEMRDAARTLVTQFGARAALVKGGHGSGDEISDVLYDGDWLVFRHERVISTSTHGTGCALSAAITAQLASGRGLRDSICSAIDWIVRAIASAPTDIGAGHGPLDHSVAPVLAAPATTSRRVL